MEPAQIILIIMSILILTGLIIIIYVLFKRRNIKKHPIANNCLQGCSDEPSSNCGPHFGCPKDKCRPICHTKIKNIGKKGHCQYDWHDGVADCSKCDCV